MPLYNASTERAASSTTPAAVGTAAVGTGTTDARDDHVHATGAGTPSTQAFGDAASTGSGPAAAMTDHKHAMPANPTPAFATNAIVLGTAAAAGVASTVIRSDDTIAAFDATAPTTQAFGDAAATGSAAVAARRDHKHGIPSITPTLPTVNSVGTEFHATTAPTATLPTHAANDILLLLLQSSNETITAPAGYKQIGPQNGIGASATSASMRLAIFWKRDGGSESAPTIADSGDHTYGVMLAIRGCPTTGDPFHFLGNTQKYVTSTSWSGATGATTIDNCLVLSILGQGIDATGGQMSSEANADLTSVTEQFDGSTTDGTGGGIVVVSGTKATAGTIAATTGTLAATSVTVDSLIAFLPSDATTVMKGTRPVERMEFYGSLPDLDDTWTKPTGARTVFVQLCDGGGGGSGGNTATTAAGGGGGGGGGYDEAWYSADALAATITVHPGKGGAAGTGLNQAGNAGVVSEFDKGGTGPLTSAYRIAGAAATAAASADGGNGGCGSGRGTVALAAQTTRAPLEALAAANALVAYGGLGGRGGSGTTAPVGGSPADWGGGGGESGADTDAATTSVLNGYSLRGAGGGSSGRTNTNISGSGAGGGGVGVISAQGASGTDSTHLPYGGAGGVGGGSSVVTGGRGGFPGGGGGGGAGVAGGFGGAGGQGCVVVLTSF